MSNIQQDIEEFGVLKDQVGQIVNGDENTEVDTASGPQPSLRKIAADVKAEALAQVNISTSAAEDHASNAADSEQACGEHAVDAEQSKVAAQEAKTGALAAESGAGVSAGAAKGDADRSLAERQLITNELAQVQTLADQVAADKDLVESTKVGNEDYVISAITKLLSSLATVVSTAISGDEWAEHCYKWGGPKQVLAAALVDKVVLYDLTKPGIPVWMEFEGSWSFGSGNMLIIAGGNQAPISSVAFVGDCLLVGSSNGPDSGNGCGLHIISFAADSCAIISGTGRRYKGGIESRNAGLGSVVDGSLPSLIQWDVNDLAARIAPDAPVDPVSGVPMATIAVATGGGVSELVPNEEGGWSARTLVTNKTQKVAYSSSGLLSFVCDDGSNSNGAGNPVYKLFDGGREVVYRYTNNIATPAAQGGWSHTAHLSSRLLSITNGGGPLLTVRHENPSDYEKSSVARITREYATPFMQGDVHCALLCDGEEGVVSGGELITNGGFDTDTSGWAEDLNGGVVSIVAGGVKLAKRAASTANTVIEQDVTIPDGETWTLGYDVLAAYYAGTLKVEFGGAVISGYSASLGRKYIDITGDGVSKVLRMICGGTAHDDTAIDIGDVSVFKAEKDRSGEGNHAIINGTLNFSKPLGSGVAVATGFADAGVKQPQNCIRKKLSPGDAIVVSMVIKNGPDGASDYDIPFHVFSGWDGTPADAYTSYLKLQNNNSGEIRAMAHKSDRGILIQTGPVATDFTPITAVLTPSGFAFYANGQMVTEWEGATDFPAGEVEVLIGTGLDGSGSASWNGDIGPLVITDTVPSIYDIRRQHRHLVNLVRKPVMLTAQLAAVARDTVRGDDYHLCTDRKLHRLTRAGATIEETLDVPAGIGDVKSLSVVDGVITVGGSADVWVSKPAKSLPAPHVMREQRTVTVQLGMGSDSLTDFYLNPGWEPVEAFKDGLLQAEGEATDSYPVKFMWDGDLWFLRFAQPTGEFRIAARVKEMK